MVIIHVKKKGRTNAFYRIDHDDVSKQTKKRFIKTKEEDEKGKKVERKEEIEIKLLYLVLRVILLFF